MRHSVAVTDSVASQLLNHLLRDDGQEDLCFARWRPSSGWNRITAILDEPIYPRDGDRNVHGNVSFEQSYVLRAVAEAARLGSGLAFMHSHPRGRGWQALNSVDQLAEARIANLARELTGAPLIGLTAAGDGSWSARFWDGIGRSVKPIPCESVRTIGDWFGVTFNGDILPRPKANAAQIRTVHTWGESIQANIARMRIAIAGVGSVGMSVAELLARTGVEHLGVFDFDGVELVNLDRLRGATVTDVRLKRSKANVAERVLEEASTSSKSCHEFHELSICEPEGLNRLLDFDLIFSCVDRPWPRHVLNTIAYADLIPVVEGGLSTFQNTDGSFRNAYWSSTIVRPGRPCLVCLRQYDPGLVQVERDGSLDDPQYIANLPRDSVLRRRENVAGLSIAVTAAMLQQFISFVARPSGFGDPGPLRYNLRNPRLVELRREFCEPDCPYSASTGYGDKRLNPTAKHSIAERLRYERSHVTANIRLLRLAESVHRLLGKALQPNW